MSAGDQNHLCLLQLDRVQFFSAGKELNPLQATTGTVNTAGACFFKGDKHESFGLGGERPSRTNKVVHFHVNANYTSQCVPRSS